MPEHFKVTLITDETGITAQGATQTQVRIDFMVGENGPFTLRIPKAEFSAERVNKDLEKFADEVVKLMPESES